MNKEEIIKLKNKNNFVVNNKRESYIKFRTFWGLQKCLMFQRIENKWSYSLWDLLDSKIMKLTFLDKLKIIWIIIKPEFLCSKPCKQNNKEVNNV